jgi:hypothetical protein
VGGELAVIERQIVLGADCHGFRSDWHPAPSKRFVMVLSGVMEVEVSDGQRRKFAPGSVNLVTDIAGRCHRTNVLGGDDVL